MLGGHIISSIVPALQIGACMLDFESSLLGECDVSCLLSNMVTSKLGEDSGMYK